MFGVYFDVMLVVVCCKCDEVWEKLVVGIDLGEVKKVEKCMVRLSVENLFEVVVCEWYIKYVFIWLESYGL